MHNTKIEFEKELFLFYQATKIPLCVFDNTPKDIYRCPMVKNMNCSVATMSQCITALSKHSVSEHIPLLYTSTTCFFALLKLDNETNLMFGPVSSVPITYKEFYKWSSSIQDLQDMLHLYHIIQQSPLFSLATFTANISLFIKLMFQEDLPIEKILESQLTFTENETVSEDELPSEPSYPAMEEMMTFQKEILFHIRNGNPNAIEKMFHSTRLFYIPDHIPFAPDEVKKIFFMYATLCYVSVIEEGLELQKAFPIFDTYISKIPSLLSTKKLIELCKQISLDYCKQIVSLHYVKSDSPVVTKCLLYIQNHLYKKITLDDLAKHCNMSRRTITRHFTEYYHMPVSEYIIHLKLDEAAFLLTHSHYSLVEISHQLTFSSQSHFTVAFKKRYQYTPQQYREKFRQ